MRIFVCPKGNKREILAEELALIIPSTNKAQFLINHSKDGEKFAQAILNKSPNLDVKMCGEMSFDEYLMMIKTCDLLVGVDSSCIHIACALKKPFLALFANSYPNLGTFKPLVPNGLIHRIITTKDQKTSSNDISNLDTKNANLWLKEQIIAFAKP